MNALIKTLQRLTQNILWGQRGNFVDIPTDCSQRCERLGWTGDIQIFSATAALADEKTPLFLEKWLNDVRGRAVSKRRSTVGCAGHL